MNETLFPVKEIPAIWTDKENGNILNKNTGHKFIIREDTNKILSCMTDEYKLVKNEDVYSIANPLIGKKGGKMIEERAYAEGARTFWRWRFPDLKVEISKNDTINPEIIIKNSYDGTVGVHAMGGAFRLVCSNGMIIGSIIKDFNAKHSIYNFQLDKLDTIIKDTIDLTVGLCKSNFRNWAKIDISENHLMEMFKLFPIEMNEFVVQYMIANKPDTLWDLYNCATNIVTHKMSHSKEATHKVEMSIFPFIKKLAAKA